MSDDKKLTDENEEIKEPESKNWQWDAAAPTVDDSFLDIAITVPGKADDDDEDGDDVTQDSADEADEDDDEDSAGEAEEDEETDDIEDDDDDDDDDGTGSVRPRRFGEAEDGCCIICGQKIKNSESELYCNECRTKYMKVDYGASHIILSVIMIFVAVIGIVTFTATTKIAAAVRTGDNYYKNGQYSNALDSYQNVGTATQTLNDNLNAFLQGISTNINEVTLFDSGEASYKKIAEIKAKKMTISYQDREDFFKLVKDHFTQKELSSAKYKDVKECYDFCKNLDNTTNEFYETWYPLVKQIQDAVDKDGKVTGKYTTHEEIFKEIDKYAQENPDAEMSVLELFRFYTLKNEESYGVETDSKELMQCIAGAYEKAGKFGYIYGEPYLTCADEAGDYDIIDKIAPELIEVDPSNDVAYYYSAKSCINKRDFDGALEQCENLRKAAPDSLEYYIIKAQVLRLNGDFDAAIDTCKEGQKSGYDAELLRQESIAYMLAGEKEKAYEAAYDAYDNSYNAAVYTGETVSLDVLNTTALIAHLCGKEDTYDKIVEILAQSNVELDETVQQVIKGEKEFRDLFMEGKGDIR